MFSRIRIKYYSITLSKLSLFQSYFLICQTDPKKNKEKYFPKRLSTVVTKLQNFLPQQYVVATES
jgi:hypothetical protein